MEYILLWLVAFVAGSVSIAKSKGRNIYLWGLLGILLGPFAILILALLKTTSTGDQDYR